MTEKETGEMTCEETKAENARLEQELRRMTEDNERLRSESAAAREKFDRAQANWRTELAKAQSVGHARVSPEEPRVDIEIPGILKVSVRGPGALRFVGIEVPNEETKKMVPDLPVDAPC